MKPLVVLIAIVGGSCDREPPAAARTQQHHIAPVAPPTLGANEIDQRLAQEGIADEEPRLHIAKQAPAIVVDGWLQGEPITFAKGRIYVVENWATWCKPCVAQIPHLSELARSFRKDVTVVAINVEHDNLDGVKAFVAGHDMDYAVAYDASGYMEQTWIAAAGLPGLPASFVIDREGTLVWLGHPERLSDVVQRVVAGTWVPAKARARARDERLALAYSKRVVSLLESKPEQAYSLIRVLLAQSLRERPEYLKGLAYHIYAGPRVARRDLDVAYLAGALGCQFDEWRDPEAIETLSKIREAQGRLSDAIALQERAVAVSQADRFTSRLAQLRGAH